jgi:hypothetical protein
MEMRSPALTELLKFLYNLSFHIQPLDETELMYSICPTLANRQARKTSYSTYSRLFSRIQLTLYKCHPLLSQSQS